MKIDKLIGVTAKAKSLVGDLQEVLSESDAVEAIIILDLMKKQQDVVNKLGAFGHAVDVECRNSRNQ